MFFKSDNTSPVCPEIMQAIIQANNSYFNPYGTDNLSLNLKEAYTNLFETNVNIFPVLTGSAANCLALSVTTPPYGIIYAHSESHIYTDECGAPGFYTRGAKIESIEGDLGKICPNELKKKLSKAGFGNVHASQPAIVSVTQITELGTIYTIDELREISDIAHYYNLPVHVDGARFANAVVHLNVSPKEVSFDAGVDILSLGATKNGAMAAEAVLFFNESHVKDFSYRQKNAGHLLSKMRFISAQLLAYIKDDLWLQNASKANLMAQKLKEGLINSNKAKILYPVEGNELFVEMDNALLCHLELKGAQFYRWRNAESTIIRLVTSYSTNLEDIHQFLNIVYNF